MIYPAEGDKGKVLNQACQPTHTLRGLINLIKPVTAGVHTISICVCDEEKGMKLLSIIAFVQAKKAMVK